MVEEQPLQARATPGARRRWFVRLSALVALGYAAILVVRSPDDYLQRSRVTEALLLASAPKRAITEYVSEHGTLPTSRKDMDWGNKPVSGKYVKAIHILENSALEVTFGGEPKLAGLTMILTPTVRTTPDGKNEAFWTCSEGSLPNRYRPESCRK